MTANTFRRLALALPDTVEGAHMDHPDFRVGGKIYASLGPRAEWGMVKLTPEQQATFLTTEPKAYKPAAGAWGRGGATIVTLEFADEASVRQALELAHHNLVAKRPAKRGSGFRS